MLKAAGMDVLLDTGDTPVTSYVTVNIMQPVIETVGSVLKTNVNMDMVAFTHVAQVYMTTEQWLQSKTVRCIYVCCEMKMAYFCN